MLSSVVFETRGARLIAALAVMLALVIFQVALQAKPAHAYEVHVSITGAGTVDEDPALTQADMLNPACSSPSTTPTGTLGASCFPGDPNGDYQWGWTVQWKATPAAGYTFVRWESDGNPKPVICDKSNPPATTSTYTGSSCKFQTFDNLQTRAVFKDDTSPARPTLSGGPSGAVNGPVSFNFSINSDPTFKYFECRVVGVHDWQTCTSPKTEDPPTSGTYTFDVRAVDWSDNKSSIASWQWTVDKTAPFANITSFPPTFWNGLTSSFGFSSSATDVARFECKLENEPSFTTCSSPRNYMGLSDGSHTFYVRAIDNVGNMGGTASRTWTIDTAIPETTLDPSVGPAPETATQDNDPNFAFSSNEAQAAFECNLMGPGLTSTAFTACSSPKGYTNLKDGTYTFKVRAKDQATNVDASPAERTWTVNSTPTVLENSLTPTKLGTGVARDTNVIASFSEEMAPTSITNLTTHVSKTFKLQMYNMKKHKYVTIPARVDVSNNTTATLDPYGLTEGITEKLLGSNKKFKVTITTGVTDSQGNPIAKNFVWTFKTGNLVG